MIYRFQDKPIFCLKSIGIENGLEVREYFFGIAFEHDHLAALIKLSDDHPGLLF